MRPGASDVLGQYLPIVVLLILAVLFAALSFVASRLLAPRSPNDLSLIHI